MLPVGAVTVVGGLRLIVLQIIVLLRRTDFVSALIQMFEAAAQESIVCSQNKHSLSHK